MYRVKNHIVAEISSSGPARPSRSASFGVERRGTTQETPKQASHPTAEGARGSAVQFRRSFSRLVDAFKLFPMAFSGLKAPIRHLPDASLAQDDLQAAYSRARVAHACFPF